MSKQYLKVNGQLVNFANKIVAYTAAVPPPVVLGYPMYIFNNGGFDVTLNGSGNVQLDNDNGSIINDHLSQKTFTLVNPSATLTLRSENVTDLTLNNQSNIYDISISGNTKIENLNINYVQIANTLDLSKNVNLKTFDFSNAYYFGNNLDVSKCTGLTTLDLYNLYSNNQLNINVSNTLISSLVIPSTISSASAILLANCPNITSITGNDSYIGTLDISNTNFTDLPSGLISSPTFITDLYMSNSKVSSVNLNMAPLKKINISNNSYLTELLIANFGYFEFNGFSGNTCPNLARIDLSYAGAAVLPSFKFEQYPALISLSSSTNFTGNVILSANTNLQYFYNQANLNILDISNTKITDLGQKQFSTSKLIAKNSDFVDIIWDSPNPSDYDFSNSPFIKNVTLNGYVGQLLFNNCPSLSSFTQSMGGYTSPIFILSGHSLLYSINITDQNSVLTTLKVNNNAISDFYYAANSVTNIDCSYNKITSLTMIIGYGQASNLISLSGNNNLFDLNEMDSILYWLDTYGANNGYCNLSGNAAGYSDPNGYKANLISKGWSVITS